MINPIGWIEIPVLNMTRAINFYNIVFGWSLKITFDAVPQMAWFPNNLSEYGSSGTLIYAPEYYVPSANGPLVYFDCENIDSTLKIVTANGGQILTRKKQISEDHGFMAVILDSEGNRIALHSASK